ncbi:hypothetical protein [Luteolibacter soli]|uniref:Uncharacterized protein n=1 Tax=Luteolibacter soli TaxID=3135280 RepID=A0ABU9B2J8_9BACT
MTDPAERFIEAAVRPLADNAELQMMAAQELRAGLPADPAPEAISFEEATANLTKPRIPPWILRSCLFLIVALAIAALLPTVRDCLKIRLALHALIFRGEDPVPLLPALNLEWHPVARLPATFGERSPQQSLLLFGDLSKRPWLDRFQALRDSTPADPALFADYARASYEDSKALPANFLTSADRIDPGNGWYQHLAAGVAARKVTKLNEVPYHIRKKGGSFPPYLIIDAPKAAEALDLLQQAAAMPRYETYEDRMLLQRLAVLPPGDNWWDRKLAYDYLLIYRPGSWISSRPNELAKLVAARSWELASTGDRHGLEQLASSWETCVIRAIQHSESTPRQIANASYGVTIASHAISKAARDLDLPALAARHEAWHEAIKARNTKPNEQNLDRIRERGGLQFADLSWTNAPSFNDSELEPGRLADHSLIRRFACAGMIAVFAVAAFLLAVTRFLRGNQARRLSHSLSHVLQPVDYAWILGGGVLLPFAVLLLLDQATPLGLQEFGIRASGCLEGTLLRFLITAAVMLTFPMLLAGRRLDMRLHCVGWNHNTVRERWILVGAAAIPAITILVTAFLRASALSSTVFQIFFWVAAAMALGFLVALLTCAVEARRKVLFWLVCGRAALPAQLVAILLAALASWTFQARELHWVKMDTVSRWEPGIPATSLREYQAAEQMRRELLEILKQ